MAAGDLVLLVQQPIPPGADFAYQSRLAGGSTPAEAVLPWTFPDGAATYLDFLVKLHGYDGGGLTLRFAWSASVATGNCELEAAFRRFQNDGEDLDTAHTYNFNTVTDTTPSAVNEIVTADITFTDGVDMDSFADNETGILRFRRDAQAGNDPPDTAAGIFYLWGDPVGFETA